MGSYEKPTFTEAERAKFSSFNGLDEFLYKMSNETFWNKANSRKGGIEQLQADVQKLKVIELNTQKFRVLENFYSDT